jgi:predicted CXXCH cytochrome family protein
MRKIFKLMMFALFGVVLISGSAYAVTGACYECHTMHASQNGTLMGDGPHNYLLLYSCIGCHSGPAGQESNSTNGAPIVLFTSGSPLGQGVGFTLAGGNFYWVKNVSDSEGHNVDIVKVGQDSDIGPNIGYNPPGWDKAQTDNSGHTIAGAADDWPVQLTCAGAYGCHGNHSISGNDDGIKGAHHSNIGVSHTVATAPTTMGGSYRFCDGIKGMEETDWEWSGDDSTHHNEYYGSTYNDAGGAPDKQTISFLCAECHGQFHTSASIGGTASPWLRHPTDIVLMSASRGTTEYSAYNNAGSPPVAAYNIIVPVARGAVPSAASNTVNTNQGATTTGAIVMCLSCHRAHGSNQPDILRWDYTTMISGGGSNNTGCFVCHTTKDTP